MGKLNKNKQHTEALTELSKALNNLSNSEQKYFKFMRNGQEQGRINLEKSLSKKPLIGSLNLKSGENLEFKLGDGEDAKNIFRVECLDYPKIILLPIISDDPSYFKIASFSNNPLKPVGFYLVMGEKEDNKIIGEPKYVRVCRKFTGNKLGSILTANSALDVIDDEKHDVLRYHIIKNGIIGKILQNLGFESCGKSEKGYDRFDINLKKRSEVRDIFQDYLNKYINVL